MPLRNLKVFIGGPIKFAIRQEGFNQELRQTIELAVEAVRDLNGQVLSAHLAEKFGVDTPAFTPEMVSRRDFAWMQECDVFMPILPVLANGELLRTDGTHIELGWASALRRPVLLVTEMPIVDNASHLLKGLEHVGTVARLDVRDFRANPWQIGEIFQELLARQPCAVQA
ncbi:nucleoside 2-deoxyribosyltransferase [Pseudomonas sp. NBRC 111139]|uniref:nucleoside 2-deoxyribosyltransferase n=1 Tax=Pseudomonas sp. NBRC 111139 TaxID=1661054 RepID=UPI000863610C|nr:nucleoside 2-deoxyribosyltransferase [Pseudomonas sp. NBRC 111139]